jgi:alpha/beta superfamily hydrolase
MIGRPASELIEGPAGALEVVVEAPDVGAGSAAQPPRGLVVVAHPHPLMGGTMDNKVVHTVVRAFVMEGWVTVRFNFRGVGRSEGAWDEGRGEVDDLLAVLAHHRTDPAWRALPVALAGFSFGGRCAAVAAERLSAQAQPLHTLVLVSPAVRYGVPAVPADTLVLQGESDDVVPLADILDWARPQSLPLTVLPGAGHFFHGQLHTVRHVVRQHVAARRPGEAQGVQGE